MAHSKQAKKRIVTNEKARIRNKARKSAMRTHVKRVLQAVESGDRETAGAELTLAQKQIDKAAKSRIIHPNNAARKKSLLARRVASMGS
jgi:small subunit ribosomal protein S20